jgi:hypothetical protein
MLYDLAQTPPESGSLLESVFLVLSKRRQEQQFLALRVLVEAALAPHLEGKSKISETFGDFVDAMFPYLKKETTKGESLEREALKQWTGHRAFRVKPLWQSKDQPRRFRSSLQRGKEKIAERERMQREGIMRRIK